MSLPTAEDINPFRDDKLDGWHAELNFLGKTLDEAETLFRENSIRYQEDLMWMGPVAFRYYVKAAIRYIQSDAASKDADMVYCFVGLLEFWMEWHKSDLFPIAEELRDACRYIVEHYERFCADETVYGDLRVRYTEMERQLLKAKSS